MERIERREEEAEDRLAPAKGILLGLVIGLVFWVLIIALVVWG